MPPDCSGIPRWSSLALLMEHRYVPDNTTIHPEDGNYWQLHLHPTFGRWWWSLGLSHRVGAIQRSHGHRSLAPWWVSRLAVYWGNQRRDWRFMFYTWCWGGIAASMWTTFDGDHSAIFLVSAWTGVAYDQCGWLSPSQECSVSTGGRIWQWITFLCHK